MQAEMQLPPDWENFQLSDRFEENNYPSYLFRLTLVISFRKAVPSKGFSSSKAHSKSSETLVASLVVITDKERRIEIPHACTVIVEFCENYQQKRSGTM